MKRNAWVAGTNISCPVAMPSSSPAGAVCARSPPRLRDTTTSPTPMSLAATGAGWCNPLSDAGTQEHDVVFPVRVYDCGGHEPPVVRGTIEACRLEAREPAGVRLGGGGDAVRAETVAIGLSSPSRPHHGALRT